MLNFLLSFIIYGFFLMLLFYECFSVEVVIDLSTLQFEISWNLESLGTWNLCKFGVSLNLNTLGTKNLLRLSISYNFFKL